MITAVEAVVADDSYLVDTNLLLRSAQPHSAEHALAVAAVATLGERGATLYLTPQSIIEFWSVATRPADVNGLGMTPAEADAELRRLEGFFVLLPDIPAIYTKWRQLVLSVGVSGRQVHDARLVAVMHAYGIRQILTFNERDFVRYTGVVAVHPQVVRTPPDARAGAEGGPVAPEE